ncbi:hypothetical protein PIB30_041452, partial [Stylosanthes scabra]|nr:hypothetical protein [Stylosanthes scabra]
MTALQRSFEKRKNQKTFMFFSTNKHKRLKSCSVRKELRPFHAPIVDFSYGKPDPLTCEWR